MKYHASNLEMGDQYTGQHSSRSQRAHHPETISVHVLSKTHTAQKVL